MNATHLLYRAASPPLPAAASHWADSEVCWLCGTHAFDHALPKDDVVKDTFADHDKCAAPASHWLCEACAWSFSEHVPMVGREKLQRLRNYSHFVVGGTWMCLSKAEKARMQELLLDPPDDLWLGILAVSGQKHIIFRAPVSLGANPAVIQFEEKQIAYTPERLRNLLTAVAALLALGFSKTEIERDDYFAARLLNVGADAWAPPRQITQAARGSSLLDLALFLAQRPNEPEEEETDNGD